MRNNRERQTDKEWIMAVSRRNFIVAATIGTVGVSTAPLASRAQELNPVLEGVLGGVSNEIQAVLDVASQQGIAPPVVAGTGPDPLVLAEVVQNALQKGTPDSLLLARRTGVLLSALSTLEREARDFPGLNEPIPAGKRAAFPLMKGYYTDLCKTAAIEDEHRPMIMRIARQINVNRDRYIEVQQRVHVPWFMIGALHYRESSLNFMGHLHNGDNLLMLTVHVPANRPKFRPWAPPSETLRQVWADSAVDALADFPKYATWSLQKVCFAMESYNGFGCYYHNINTPYLWNYTDKYSSGGYK